MKDYYRKLIAELLPKVNDELKLHEIYVLVLVNAGEGGESGVVHE